MDCLLVTPTSTADLELLTTLFKKMKIKSEVVPAASAAAPRRPPRRPPRRKAEATVEAEKAVPRNKIERDLVEAIEEMKEIMAGRKPAMSLKQFLDELK